MLITVQKKLYIMIGSLTGTISLKSPDNFTLEVGGVGYIIYTHNKFMNNYSTGEKITVITHLQVKENEMSLYGFSSYDEKKCFEMLKVVQGVGSRLALSILNIFDINTIEEILHNADVEKLITIQGVGSKIAKRIITELGNKTISNTQFSLSLPKQNAISALQSLGFKKSDVFSVVSKSQSNSEETIIRETLSKLSKV